MTLSMASARSRHQMSMVATETPPTPTVAQLGGADAVVAISIRRAVAIGARNKCRYRLQPDGASRNFAPAMDPYARHRRSIAQRRLRPVGPSRHTVAPAYEPRHFMCPMAAPGFRFPAEPDPTWWSYTRSAGLRSGRPSTSVAGCCHGGGGVNEITLPDNMLPSRKA
jgi:hypothetical protein